MRRGFATQPLAGQCSTAGAPGGIQKRRPADLQQSRRICRRCPTRHESDARKLSATLAESSTARKQRQSSAPTRPLIAVPTSGREQENQNANTRRARQFRPSTKYLGGETRSMHAKCYAFCGTQNKTLLALVVTGGSGSRRLPMLAVQAYHSIAFFAFWLWGESNEVIDPKDCDCCLCSEFEALRLGDGCFDNSRV